MAKFSRNNFESSGSKTAPELASSWRVVRRGHLPDRLDWSAREQCHADTTVTCWH